MLSRLRVGVCLLVLSAGCSDDGKTKSAGESVASCECPIDWAITNSALCVAPPTTYSPPIIFSSYLDSRGAVVCDKSIRFPQPVPSQPWSEQSMMSRCTGKGTLTLRVRHGQANGASEDDCVLVEQVITFDYKQANKRLELAPAEAWSARDEACARSFEAEGGYFEFRLESETLGCGAPDEKVNYVDICPAACAADPTGAGCEACTDEPDQNRL